MTYFVTEYWELLVLRCCLGLPIGGGAPLVMSMLGDMFPSHQRMTVIGYCVALGALGVALAQLVAGMVGPAYGWRMPFAFVAIPGIILNLVVLFTIAEPKRGYADLRESAAFKKERPDGKGTVYSYEQRITLGKLLGLYRASYLS